MLLARILALSHSGLCKEVNRSVWWRVFRPVTVSQVPSNDQVNGRNKTAHQLPLKQPIESTAETTVKRSPRTNMLRASITLQRPK